jgi:hypothetical protein
MDGLKPLQFYCTMNTKMNHQLLFMSKNVQQNLIWWVDMSDAKNKEVRTQLIDRTMNDVLISEVKNLCTG